MASFDGIFQHSDRDAVLCGYRKRDCSIDNSTKTKMLKINIPNIPWQWHRPNRQCRLPILRISFKHGSNLYALCMEKSRLCRHVCFGGNVELNEFGVAYTVKRNINK